MLRSEWHSELMFEAVCRVLLSLPGQLFLESRVKGPQKERTYAKCVLTLCLRRTEWYFCLSVCDSWRVPLAHVTRVFRLLGVPCTRKLDVCRPHFHVLIGTAHGFCSVLFEKGPKWHHRPSAHDSLHSSGHRTGHPHVPCRTRSCSRSSATRPLRHRSSAFQRVRIRALRLHRTGSGERHR